MRKKLINIKIILLGKVVLNFINSYLYSIQCTCQYFDFIAEYKVVPGSLMNNYKYPCKANQVLNYITSLYSVVFTVLLVAFNHLAQITA